MWTEPWVMWWQPTWTFPPLLLSSSFPPRCCLNVIISFWLAWGQSNKIARKGRGGHICSDIPTPDRQVKQKQPWPGFPSANSFQLSCRILSFPVVSRTLGRFVTVRMPNGRTVCRPFFNPKLPCIGEKCFGCLFCRGDDDTSWGETTIVFAGIDADTCVPCSGRAVGSSHVFTTGTHQLLSFSF